MSTGIIRLPHLVPFFVIVGELTVLCGSLFKGALVVCISLEDGCDSAFIVAPSERFGNWLAMDSGR